MKPGNSGGGKRVSVVSADLDVVVNNDGKNDEDPHGEYTHSRDGFHNQARQNRPSTAED
jgi:hypothetical protein